MNLMKWRFVIVSRCFCDERIPDNVLSIVKVGDVVKNCCEDCMGLLMGIQAERPDMFRYEFLIIRRD